MDFEMKYWAPKRKLGGGWICYKSDPEPPAAPDPVATAAAQTKSNIDTANNNAALNRINQTTPWGSSTYTRTPGVDGAPDTWSQNTTLAPDQQKLLDAQNHDSLALSATGQKMLGTVDNVMSNPLDFSKITKVGGNEIQRQVDMSRVPSLVGGNQLATAMKTAQDAAFNQQKSRLDPTFKNSGSDLENKLTQQGIMRNTDAWNRATDEFSRDKNDAYQTAYNNSVNNGNAAQAQLFGQGLAANQNAYGQALSNGQFANQASGQVFAQTSQQRNQDLNEIMTQRQNPLNELNALRTGSQVQAPTFGATPQVNQAGTDVAGITNNAFNNQLGIYNGKISSNNATMGALGQLGGAAILSDIRLKDNIKRVGSLDNGLPVYTYNYIGDNVPQMGVMAQDVEKVMPEAVSTHASGYKQVHYGML